MEAMRSTVARALHRLMYEESRGEGLATAHQVLHLCHRRACIQPSHLYLGSDADNAEDRARRFRQPYLPDIPAGREPLGQRLRAALYSDFDRLQVGVRTVRQGAFSGVGWCELCHLGDPHA